APIAAGVYLNISDTLLANHHVSLIPQRKDGHVAADDVLGLRIKRRGPGVVVGVHGLREDLIELRIAIAAAIPRGARFSRNLGSRKQVAIENRILITAHPLAVGHLKL